MANQRPPLPPFTLDTAVQKVRLAEDGWNSRTPEKVALAYTEDSYWRNRAEFVQGREAIVMGCRARIAYGFFNDCCLSDQLTRKARLIVYSANAGSERVIDWRRVGAEAQEEYGNPIRGIVMGG